MILLVIIIFFLCVFVKSFLWRGTEKVSPATANYKTSFRCFTHFIA